MVRCQLHFTLYQPVGQMPWTSELWDTGHDQPIEAGATEDQRLTIKEVASLKQIEGPSILIQQEVFHHKIAIEQPRHKITTEAKPAVSETIVCQTGSQGLPDQKKMVAMFVETKDIG